jgi:hypothetical protein
VYETKKGPKKGHKNGHKNVPVWVLDGRCEKGTTLLE